MMMMLMMMMMMMNRNNTVIHRIKALVSYDYRPSLITASRWISYELWLIVYHFVGFYWVDPNMGCKSDAIKVYCNITDHEIATCVTPETSMVKILPHVFIFLQFCAVVFSYQLYVAYLCLTRFRSLFSRFRYSCLPNTSTFVHGKGFTFLLISLFFICISAPLLGRSKSPLGKEGKNKCTEMVWRRSRTCQGRFQA